MVIKKFWREIVIVILIVAVAISVRTCKTHKDNESAALSINDSIYTKLKEYKLNNGQLVTQVQTQELTAQQLKENIGSLGLKNSNLEQQVGNWKRLAGYWQVQAQVKQNFTTSLHDTIYVDSSGVKKKGKDFAWDNKYMHMTGFIQQDFSTIDIGYIYDVKFELSAYRKKKPLTDYLKLNFKPGMLISDVVFDDENIRVTKFSGLEVKEKKAWTQTTGFKVGVGALSALIARKLIFK